MDIATPLMVEDALARAAEEGGACSYMAGGTALQLEWAKGRPKPGVMISPACRTCAACDKQATVSGSAR